MTSMLENPEMYFIPGFAYPDMSESNLAVSGTILAAYENYAKFQKEYQSSTMRTHIPSTEFYMVLAFPQGDFADQLEMHADLPMMIPASGISPTILGVFEDETRAKVSMSKDGGKVHMMYKFKMSGHDDIQDFLNFMAEHAMLQPQGAG